MSQWRSVKTSITSTPIIRLRRLRVVTRVGATRRLRSTINIRTASDWCANGKRCAVSILCRRRRRLTSTHRLAFSFTTIRPIVQDWTIQKRFNNSSNCIYGIETILKMRLLVTRCPDQRSTVVEDPDSALGTIMTVTRRNLSSSHLVWHLLLIRSVGPRQSGFIGRNFLYSSASLWTISIVRKRERDERFQVQRSSESSY